MSFLTLCWSKYENTTELLKLIVSSGRTEERTGRAKARKLMSWEIGGLVREGKTEKQRRWCSGDHMLSLTSSPVPSQSLGNGYVSPFTQNSFFFFIAEHAVIQHGISLFFFFFLVWFSCPICEPSQLLAYPLPTHTGDIVETLKHETVHQLHSKRQNLDVLSAMF